MGFINPGIRYVFDKNRKGRKNKAFNNTIYANENKNFNRRYPNNLYMRYIHKINQLYYKIRDVIRSKFKLIAANKFNDFRQLLEKYILLVHQLEIFINVKNLYPIKKELALKMLKIIMKIQADEKYILVNDNLKSGIIPQLETVFDNQFQIIEGGGILLNSFFEKQLLIELKEQEEYGINNETDFSKKSLLKTDDARKMRSKRKKIKSITQLPDDILVKILTYSHNVNNMALTSHFFHSFVLSHKEFISYELIESKYVHRYKLKPTTEIDITMENDLQHLENSHKFSLEDGYTEEYSSLKEMILSDFKFTDNEKFISTRYRDADVLTVISSGSFETPYFTYENYKSLKIDRVIPPSSWPDMEEQYNDARNKSGDNMIDKAIFEDFWNELCITMPFINKSNPSSLIQIKNEDYVDKLRIILDLMVNKTRFVNKLEDIVTFLVALVVKIEESILDHEGSILPPQMVKDYCVFYMNQLKKGGDEDDENTDIHMDESDDTIWKKIQFKNPYLYSMLKHHANEELEDLLSPRFYHENISNNYPFWLGLKRMKGDDLIEELINEFGTTPSLDILTTLASY